jgi:AcrR family transcriptional regulator
MPRDRAANAAIRAERKRQILAAATAVFAAGGIARATMQQVAAEAGVSPGLLYRHFRSKDELVRAVLRPALAGPFGLVANAPQGDPDATLLHLSKGLLRAVQEQPVRYQLYFASFLQPAVAPVVAALRAELRDRARALDELLAGAFRARGDDDPASAAVWFRAALNGLALALIRGEPLDVDAAAARLLAPAGAAAAAPAPAARPQARVPTISPLDAEVIRRLHPELGVPEPAPSTDELLARAPELRVRRARDTVVAYARVARSEDVLHVRELVTDPAARRQGHGRRLLRAIAQEAAAAGARRWRLHVKADNAAAIALYRSLGMRERARTAAIAFEDGSLRLLPRYRGEIAPAASGAAEQLGELWDRVAPRAGEPVLVARAGDGGALEGVLAGDGPVRVAARTRGALGGLLRSASAGGTRVALVPEKGREARWALSGGGTLRFVLVELEGSLRRFSK